MTQSHAGVEDEKVKAKPARKRLSLIRRLDRLESKFEMLAFKKLLMRPRETKSVSMETDKAGRVTLGKAQANKNFIVTYKENGTIELVPALNIPLNQLWLFQNPESLATLDRGMAQSEAGETVEYDFTADFLP